MASPKLSRSELKIMEALWRLGPSSVRQVQDTFPGKRRPAYTTVQTMIYRLEAKKAVKRTSKIGGALVFEALVTRDAARSRLLDELLELFGGRAPPLMSQLIESGKLTLEDIEEARKVLRKPVRKE